VYPQRKIAARSGLAPSTDWVVQTDLGGVAFPTDIVTTAQWPDMLVQSRSLETFLLVELTVSLEENMEWAHERELLRYEQLAQHFKSKGWRCDVFAVEVGCRGFVGKSTVNLLRMLGSEGRRLRFFLKEVVCTAERCSAERCSAERCSAERCSAERCSAERCLDLE